MAIARSGPVRARWTALKRASTRLSSPRHTAATAYFAQAARRRRPDGIVNMSQKSAWGGRTRRDTRRPIIGSRAGLRLVRRGRPISPNILGVSGDYSCHDDQARAAPRCVRPPGKHAPIASRDQGRVIARHLEDPRAQRRASTHRSARFGIQLRGDARVPGAGAGQAVRYQHGSPSKESRRAVSRRREKVGQGWHRIPLSSTSKRSRIDSRKRDLRGHQRPRPRDRRPSPTTPRGFIPKQFARAFE